MEANGRPSQSKTYLIMVIVISPVLQERENQMSCENCGGELCMSCLALKPNYSLFSFLQAHTTYQPVLQT